MKRSALAEYGEYIALGTHIAASMLVPVIIGIYADRKLGTEPWGTLVGTFAGFAGLISIVLKLVASSGKPAAKQKQRKE
jgi:F0F1-type ATP synthase assembly protein I